MLAFTTVACHVKKRRKKAERYNEQLKAFSESVGRLVHTMNGAKDTMSHAPTPDAPLQSYKPAFFTSHLAPSIADARRSLAAARKAGERLRKGSSGALKKETAVIQGSVRSDEALLGRLDSAARAFVKNPASPQAQAELKAVQVAWRARAAQAKKEFKAHPDREGILTLGPPLQYWYELAASRITSAVIKTEEAEDNIMFYALIYGRPALAVFVVILAIIFGIRMTRRMRKATEEPVDGSTCSACGATDIEHLDEGRYRCRKCDYAGQADP